MKCISLWISIWLAPAEGAGLDGASLSSLHADVMNEQHECIKREDCDEGQHSLLLMQKGHRQRNAADGWPHITQRFSAMEVGLKTVAGKPSHSRANNPTFCPSAGLGSPSLCPQGKDHWERSELQRLLPEFISLYKHRPSVALQSPNHAFALWFTVKKLQPKFIIESGVFRGGSTWLLREAAGPLTKIYSVDPVPWEFVTWKDAGNTTYFIGRNFTDFANMSWSKYIPEADKKNTLVMLDDHMSAIKRVKNMLDHGFVHAWYDDNYHYGEPGQDCYSFNTICSPLAESKSHDHDGGVVFMDKFKSVNRLITLEEHRRNLEFISKHVEVYYEFPAAWNGACDDDGELLGSYELKLWGLPGPHEGKFHWYTAHPPYVKLRA